MDTLMNMRVERKKYLDHKIDISCIILSNLNDLFVKERVIPSIINYSKSYSIEIIVVDVSPLQNFTLDDIEVVKSEPYHIPKGYNKGVSKAKGRYIALFHDDCEISDDKWVDKLTNELNETIYAVSPEKYHNSETTFLKEVPLVMQRDNFLNIGYWVLLQFYRKILLVFLFRHDVFCSNLVWILSNLCCAKLVFLSW